MTQSLLTKIRPGYEGWIYLLHAQSTPRYKIGRSVNPIARSQDIQKQAPYPIEIISTFWTLNTVVEESHLHKQFEKYRVFGEWFEFYDSPDDSTDSVLDKVEFTLRSSNLISLISNDSIQALLKPLDLEFSQRHEGEALASEIKRLYHSLTSRESLATLEKFIRETLPNLVSDTHMSCVWWGKNSVEAELQAISFIHGALRSFAFTELGLKGTSLTATWQRGWEVVT